MKQSVAMMTVLSGLCFLPVCFPRIYKIVPSAISWTSAKNYCRNKYTDLATVHNEQDLATITKLTTGFYSIWIGLQPDPEAWRWSLEYQNYYGEGEAEFRKWAVNEPNGGPGLYKACVAMFQSGEWGDLACVFSYPFICYEKNSLNKNCQIFADTSSFINVNVSKTWENAQSYCREYYTDLASVRNQSENEQLKKMLKSPCTWIGLYRNSWKWSDGSAVSFTNWAPGNPATADTKACSTTYAGKWYNSVCTGNNYFMCYIATKNQRLLKVELKKTDTSVDMEELQKGILEKLSQRLAAHRLSEFQLTWVKQPDGKIFHKKDEEEEEKEEDQE